jgi:RNA polymerase sigma factor (sigma-70 family)
VPIQPRGYESDIAFVRRVLQGDDTAAFDLRQNHHTKMVAFLCAKGAGKSEADDLIADIWSDCFSGGRREQSSLLTKYGGRCALESWLITVATNRFIDLRRRERLRQHLLGHNSNRSANNLDDLPAASPFESETALTELLLHCIRKAFSECPPETLLMLKLVHIYDVTQREIAQMWQCHESTVCRTLNLARRDIKTRVLAEAKNTDPWLRVRWDDFVQLCTGLTVSGMRGVLDYVQVSESQESKEEDSDPRSRRRGNRSDKVVQ